MPNRFIKFSVLAFIIGGIILILGRAEWFPDFYNPRFMGIVGLISVFLIILPPLIFHPLGNQAKQKSLNFLQSSLTSVLILNAFGGLGLFKLYNSIFGYDKFVHLFAPFVATLSLIYFIHYWYGKNIKKSIISAAIMIILTGFLWELSELTIDYLFETETFGHYGEIIIRDTIGDLIWNTLGIGTAVIYVKITYQKRIESSNI